MNTKRILSLVLALATVFSTVGLTALTAFADDGLLFSESFEGYITSTKAEIAEKGGTTYPAGDGFHYVLDVEGEHDNVAYMPNVYHAGFTKSPALSYTVNGGKITATADYCINVPEGVSNESFNFAIRSTSSATFVSDTIAPSGGMLTEGNWPAFACIRGDSSAGENKYRLYLDTSKTGGYANANEDIFYAVTGVESVLIDANTWFTVIIDFDLAAGTYILSYKDAARSIVLGQARPCASYHDGNAWQVSTGMRNITMSANTFAMGYVLDAGYRGDNWGETAVLMDNVRFEHTQNAPVIDFDTLSFETFDYGTYTPSTAEQMSLGSATKYSMTDGFCYVRDLDGEHENAAWLPNQYHAGYTKSPTLSYTMNGGKITTSSDYYINVPAGYESEAFRFGIRSVAGATFESDTDLTSASSPSFAYIGSVGNGTYRLYLDTSYSGGWINPNEDIYYVNSNVTYVDIQANTWFTVVIDFDLVSGLYILSYKDATRSIVLGQARPRASYHDGSAWQHSNGMRNITMPANSFAAGYVLANGSNDPTPGQISVYVDNVRFRNTTDAPVIDFNTFSSETFDYGTYTSSTAEGIADKTATRYMMNDGFCYVRDVDGEHENVAWLPNIYHAGYSKSPALSYATNGGKITATADYCINVPEGAENENINFGIRTVGYVSFESDTFDANGNPVTSGTSPNFACIRSAGNGLYRLYLDTSKAGGWMPANTDIFYTNSDVTYIEIPANTWFTVVIYMDLATGLYTLSYRDAGGETVLGCARPCAQYNDGSWKYTSGIRNISIPENLLAMGYMLNAGFNDDNWNNDNFDPSKCGNTSVCVDNVRFSNTVNAPVIDTTVISLESFDNAKYTATTSEEIAAEAATQYPTSGGGYHYVLDVDGEHENVAWLHNAYHRGYDRSPVLSYTNKDGKIAFSADYYINLPRDAESGDYINEKLKLGIRSTGGATFESDSTDGEGKMITSGNWPAFAYIESTGTGTYRLYLDTSKSGGYLVPNEAHFYYGDATYIEILPNTWFTVLIDFDLVTGVYTLTYRDAGGDTILGSARTCAYYHNGTGWVQTLNTRNITMPANTFAAGYVLANGSNDPTPGETSVYVDNVRFGYASSEIELVSVASENLMYVLVNGRKIYSNQFYAMPDTEYEAVYFDPSAYAELLTTVKAASVRVSIPAGLRFATEINDVDLFDALYDLKEAGDIKDVTFGTLIVPTDYLTGELTKEALKLAGKKYLEVEANYGKYYAFDNDPDTTHFVGSIVNMYESSVARPFSACGYVTVTLRTGQMINLYSAVAHSTNVKDVATAALADTTQNWSDSARSVLETFAAGQLPPLSQTAQQRRDMNGLNVLAIGDSLFGGHSLADGEQWLEILAEECKWNLTNLGQNGWVVTYNPEAFASPSEVRPSMYHYLMNDDTYCFGSTARGYTVGNTADKSFEDVDLIFLEGGWNDYNNFIPLGTPTDTDGSTYMGAINAMVAELLRTYPNAKIVLTTSWHNEGTRASDGANWMDFLADGMKSVYNQNYADNDRVCVLDAGDPILSEVHMYDASWMATYAMDPAHLNAEGMKVMAESMLPLIWDIMEGYDADGTAADPETCDHAQATKAGCATNGRCTACLAIVEEAHGHAWKGGFCMLCGRKDLLYKDNEKTRVICVGDSITAGGYWKNNLCGYLSGADYEVIGLGVSGTTGLWTGVDLGFDPTGAPYSYVTKPQYEQSQRYNGDVVVIMLGTNDTKPVNYEKITADNGAQFKADMTAMVKAYQAQGNDPQVFLALPATIYRDPSIGTMSNDNLEELIIPCLEAVAAETGAILIDVHGATANQSENFPDGVHPNDAGKAVIAQTIATAIKENGKD